MVALRVVDESLRDGPQSLWANRFPTREAIGAAGLISKTGVDVANLISGVGFEVSATFMGEDPVAKLKALANEVKPASRSILLRGRHLFGWGRYDDEVVDFFLRGLQTFGVDEILIFDALMDLDNIRHHFKAGSRLGLTMVGSVGFSESPIQTDEYLAAKGREMVDAGAHRLALYDATGTITPDRVTDVVRALRTACPGTPIDMAIHDQTGIAEACYRAGLEVGIDGVHTAAAPVAWGNSIGATKDIVRMAHQLDYDLKVDEAEVDELDAYFRFLCRRLHHPVGQRVPYVRENFEAYLGHQIPGGMMAHFVRQLHDLGVRDRIPEVLEEAGRVREDLGYPVMVTPFSQIVGVQAAFNVLEGSRYKTCSTDLVDYVRGAYGRPPGELSGEVVDAVEKRGVGGGRAATRIELAPNRGATLEERFADLFLPPGVRSSLSTPSARDLARGRALGRPLFALMGSILERGLADRIVYQEEGVSTS